MYKGTFFKTVVKTIQISPDNWQVIDYCKAEEVMLKLKTCNNYCPPMIFARGRFKYHVDCWRVNSFFYVMASGGPYSSIYIHSLQP